MDLIQLNKVRKERLLIMLKKLFEGQYNYISIKKSGVVIFKKSIWSFQKKGTTVAELCITDLPVRISAYKLAQHMSVVEDDLIAIVIKTKNYMNIVDCLWNEFIKINFPIAALGFSTSREKYKKIISKLLFGNRIMPERLLMQREVKAIALTANKILTTQ